MRTLMGEINTIGLWNVVIWAVILLGGLVLGMAWLGLWAREALR